jgi:predicted O-methyltransferase YrrM
MLETNSQNSHPLIESVDKLDSILQETFNGILTIKPRVIFESIESLFSIPPRIQLPVPSSKIGSVTTLEASLICSLMLIKKPKFYFEFGTFLGYTTAIMLLNSESTSKVMSIDLPKEDSFKQNFPSNVDWNLVRSNDAYNDQYLTDLAHERGEYYLTDLVNDSRLILVKQDSLEFNIDAHELKNSVDLIFIDGGHTLPVVESDTNKAFQLLSSNGIIIWHDFGSKIHTKVTEVVERVARDRIVIHIENTMLAICGRDNSFLST